MKGLLVSDFHYGFDGQTEHIVTRFLKRIEKEEWDFMIIAGDIISDSPDQFAEFGKLVRSIITRPIFVVYGNHDYWGGMGPQKPDNSYLTWYCRVQREKQAVCDKYDIHYLQKNAAELGDIVILGMDGWYNRLNPPSNDSAWMPKFDIQNPHKFMREQAEQAMQYIMDYETDKKIVIVNHFQTFPSTWGIYKHATEMCGPLSWHFLLTDKAKVYCVGHSHVKETFSQNGCLVLNSGSDYNDPSWKMFNL